MEGWVSEHTKEAVLDLGLTLFKTYRRAKILSSQMK